MSKIVAVRKDEHGTINEYKLDNGTTIGVEQAVQMTHSNEIQGCNVGRARNGKEVIRSNRNDSESDNLDSLPTF